MSTGATAVGGGVGEGEGEGLPDQEFHGQDASAGPLNKL